MSYDGEPNDASWAGFFVVCGAVATGYGVYLITGSSAMGVATGIVGPYVLALVLSNEVYYR
jgi:hypothetical protein